MASRLTLDYFIIAVDGGLFSGFSLHRNHSLLPSHLTVHRMLAPMGFDIWRTKEGGERAAVHSVMRKCIIYGRGFLSHQPSARSYYYCSQTLSSSCEYTTRNMTEELGIGFIKELETMEAHNN